MMPDPVVVVDSSSIPLSEGINVSSASNTSNNLNESDKKHSSDDIRVEVEIDEKDEFDNGWDRLSKTAPLNAFRSAVEVNRMDLVERLINEVKSGSLTNTKIIPAKEDSNYNPLDQNQDNEQVTAANTAPRTETAQNKVKKAGELEETVDVPITILSLILANESLLDQELSAHNQFERVSMASNQQKKGKKETKEDKKKAAADERRAKRMDALKIRRGDSNIHRAVNAACTAAQANSSNPCAILSLLLGLLFPGGDTAVAVNLDDLDNLDNQLSIKVDKNSALEVKNKLGSTPLHHASSRIQAPAECVRLLLQYGADISARNLSGSSPLHVAAYIGNVKACEILLDSVAPSVRLSMLTSCNFAGLTPRDYARAPALKAVFAKHISASKSRPSSAMGTAKQSARSRPASAKPVSAIAKSEPVAEES